MTDSEKRVYAFLAENGLFYRHARHRRISALSDCRLAEEKLSGCMPKNLLLTPKTCSEYHLLVMHPKSVFRTSLVSKQVGSSRLQFASDEALNGFFHTHPGAVSPFGFLFDPEKRVRLILDKRLLQEEFLIFHPLENTASLRMPTRLFVSTVLPLLERTPVWIDMPEI